MSEYRCAAGEPITADAPCKRCGARKSEGCGPYLARIVAEHEAQAAEIERLRAVLREARDFISEQHAMIVDSHSRLDADGEPIPGTLDPAAEEEIARLQALINRIDAPMSSKPEGESNG